MSNSKGGPGGFLAAILDFINSIFGGSQTPAPGIPVAPRPSSSLPPDNTTEPLRIVTSHVLLVIYDPVVDTATGAKLSQVMKWNRVDDLVNSFMTDILETSGGLARYQIIERMELNEFPVLTDGFRYDPASYANVLKRKQPPSQPEKVDYHAILNGLNILPRIASRELDEVWVFNFPFAGFYESVMGGAGAYWCNSNPLHFTSGFDRKFVIMGFSPERGIGEMLENFGHRAESILSKVFNCQGFLAWANNPLRVPAFVDPTSHLNLFQQYICFDQIAPGKAAVGSIHYAPNSAMPYEWNNPHQVSSNCYDWVNFPRFQNDIRLVNASEWGNGDIRQHHKWWLKHLLKVSGRTGGIANNWWQYILDPNLVNP